MLELRALQQEPVCDLVTFSVPCHLTLNCVHDRHWLLRLLLLLELLVFLNYHIALFQLGLVRFDLVRREGNLTKAVQERQYVFSREFVLGEAEELKRSVLLEDCGELLDCLPAEVVIRQVQHFQVPVHCQIGVWLEGEDDVLQVFVFETTRTHEDYLELLSFRDDPGKQADFLRSVLISGWLDLVELVGAGLDGIARLEFLRVERIPVKEKVCDRAVIF